MGGLFSVSGRALRLPSRAHRSTTSPVDALSHPLRWAELYRETELYKAALRVYTKPLFNRRKALSVSSDLRTLYDFAADGLAGIERIHRALTRQDFVFRPALALHYDLNGRARTMYVSPWEERIVDLLLYRLLTKRLHRWFSPNAYAYRDRIYGLDSCQSGIAAFLRAARGPVYVLKRDISDYFASIEHARLLEQLRALIAPDDFLSALLAQRIAFPFIDDGDAQRATRGVPFGSAVACVLANLYLTPLDRRLEAIDGLRYFRYADDILVLTADRSAAERAQSALAQGIAELALTVKPSHTLDLVLGGAEPGFAAADSFRHLGLLFAADGTVRLAREKTRKIQNIFRFAFRRRKHWRKLPDPRERARALAAIAADALAGSVRNVAIVDYYLKHVDDEAQLRCLDRWLAEEVLSHVFGGHKKGHFARLSYEELRALGLPSLVHRRRLIRHGHIVSPFFVWRSRIARSGIGTVVRPATPAFSPSPQAAAAQPSVREDGRLSVGVIE
jgi:reverse transcriptase-like protein